MSRTSTRIAYRVAEVADLVGIRPLTVRRMITKGIIPRIEGPGMDSLVLIPAWSVKAFEATGDWRHPDWRPVPPGVDVDTTADVIPLHPDAS